MLEIKTGAGPVVEIVVLVLNYNCGEFTVRTGCMQYHFLDIIIMLQKSKIMLVFATPTPKS